MGFGGNLRKAGGAGVKTLVESNPVTKAISGTLSALGIGGQHNRRGEAISRLKSAISRGDWAYVQKAATGAKYGRKRAIAQAALELGTTDPEAARQRFLAKKAAGAEWPSSNGPVPFVASSSKPVSRVPSPSPTPSRSARAAPKPTRSRAPRAPAAPRPCAYGARGPDGRCPKAPCKYGARGPDGRCPGRPSAAPQTFASKATRDAVNRAVTAGGTAAAAAARAVLKTVGPGVVVSTIAKASLVGAAGLAAYALTSYLQRARFKTYADLKKEVADAYRHARQQAAEAAGRPLTREELAQFTAYYRSRRALLDQAEAAGVSLRNIRNLTFED